MSKYILSKIKNRKIDIGIIGLGYVGSAILKKLQNLLKEKDTDIFVINRSDEYLNEYISPNAERLNFITNFSGSAGRAIITPTDAFLYVDGRYTFQANTQINDKEIQAKHLNSFWTDLEKIFKAIEELQPKSAYKLTTHQSNEELVDEELFNNIVWNSSNSLTWTQVKNKMDTY